MNLVGGNLTGYVQAEGKCLRFSGFSASTVNRSTCSSHGHSNSFSKFKISLNQSSKSTSYICCATPGSYRRNPDFSKQNKQGYSRRTSRQNEERDDTDNIEEPESFPSKNGSSFSISGTERYQATATPGPREKEIVELFKQVQAKLRERAGIKEDKKDEDPEGESKQGETVDSLLNLLRKHSAQKTKRNNVGSSRSFGLDQAGLNGRVSEKKRSPSLESNNVVKQDVKESEPSFFRPVSNFQKRSPIKSKPTYSNEEIVNSVSHPNMNGKIQDEKRLAHEPEPEPEHEPEPELESKVDADSIFTDGVMFDGMLVDYDSSESDEGEDDEEEEHVNEQRDLSGLKVAELRAVAKIRGVKGYSKLKKGELLELLTGDSV